MHYFKAFRQTALGTLSLPSAADDDATPLTSRNIFKILTNYTHFEFSKYTRRLMK